MTRQIPMLFKAEMVRAILEGRKTETRRILKRPSWAQEEGWPHKIMDQQELDGSVVWFAKDTGCVARLPEPQPGDLIWGKETWCPKPGYSNWDLLIHYHADGKERHIPDDGIVDPDWNWPKHASRGVVSPLFLPKWASRFTLRVKEFHVEPLQDITHAGAIAEGIERMKSGRGFYDVMAGHGAVRLGVWHRTAVEAYAALWTDINGQASWDQNPWVGVTKFELIEKNVLEVAA